MDQITLDYIIKDCNFFSSYDNTFISAIEKMISFPRSVKKVVYYDVKKIFNVNNVYILKIIDGIKYFEFEFPRDGDIISNIKCNLNSKLYIDGKTFDSNKRLVICASMYTNIKFMIMVDESLLVPNDLKNLIYISYRVNVLDIELRNNIRGKNLVCDGLVYLNGCVYDATVERPDSEKSGTDGPAG